MTSVTTLPHSRPLTVADLEGLPDDGHRYELVDGALVVTPAPRPQHQRVVRSLLIELDAACPPDLEVFSAPLDIVLADDTVLQPDVVVVRRSDIAELNVPAVPVLAVEVLSPSTRLVDLTLKRARYEAAGCPSYWVVDPEALTFTAWDLRGGTYVETVSTDRATEVREPFDLLIDPTSWTA